MHSHEALKAAIGTDAGEFAKRLRLSTSIIYKWQEPSSDWSDSGALNPLDRLIMIQEIALILGKAEEDALAPLYHQAEHFNKIIISIPQKTSMPGLMQDLLKSISEFGEMTKETSRAMQDGEITPREADRIFKEGNEAIRQIATFIAKIKESVK